MTSATDTMDRKPTPRVVSPRDDPLVGAARDAAASLRWGRFLRASTPGATQWKWIKNSGDFSLYTRSDGVTLAVLAVGLVDASMPELASLLNASNNEQHVARMEALLHDQFKGGALDREVDLSDADPICKLDTDAVLSQLSVKTVTFAKPNVLSSHEEWRYVDAVYTHESGHIFEKHMATVPAGYEVSDAATSSWSAKQMQNVTCGFYCTQTEQETQGSDAASVDIDSLSVTSANGSAKVHFYAQLDLRGQVKASSSTLSTSAVRSRLVRLAQACSRLSSLVRRRRLGVQVLVDNNRIFPPTNVPCLSCDKHLLIAKLCRICGCGVCPDCSSKYERERKSRRSDRLRIEKIRVCVYCIRRVDAADYSHLGDASFAPAEVSPDVGRSSSASTTLTPLLLDALKNATTEEKKMSVMNVIRCVVDDVYSPTASNPISETELEDTRSPQVATSTKPKNWIQAASMEECVQGLLSLTVPSVSQENAPTAESNGRGYSLNPKNLPTVYMPHPVPADEEKRVQIIKESGVRELDDSEELTLICQMAAREVDCFAAMVSLVDANEIVILAASLPFGIKSLGRADGICGHAVMSQDPLMVLHPEADIRFHQCTPVAAFGVKYYCGFPIIVRGAVVGALACIDLKTRELTTTQYVYVTKLAGTIAKLITTKADTNKTLGVQHTP